MRDSGSELHISFIDLVKAFDTVEWDLMFQILQAMGFPNQIVLVIRSLYKQTRFKVKWLSPPGPGSGTELFCIISPIKPPQYDVIFDTPVLQTYLGRQNRPRQNP